MDLRQLHHFVAVAEAMSFTRAAQRVNIVQSALSSSLRQLETEIGATLLVRNTRQMRLTTAGRLFLAKAQTVLDAARDARDAVARLQGLQQGTLSLGAVPGLPAFLGLPALIAAFHPRHPGVEVRLCQGCAADLAEKVRDGRIDLAFLPCSETPRDLAATMVACEALVIACAAGHPLAGRADLAFADIRDQPFVDFGPDWGTRRLVDRCFAESGIERSIAFEISDLETLLQLVERGLGIALVPEAIVAARAPALGMARLGGPDLCWEVMVAYAAAGSGPVDAAPEAFLALLSERVTAPAG